MKRSGAFGYTSVVVILSAMLVGVVATAAVVTVGQDGWKSSESSSGVHHHHHHHHHQHHQSVSDDSDWEGGGGGGEDMIDAVPSMPAWNRGYPVILRGSCKRNNSLGILWSYNTSNSSLQLSMAAAPTNCLEYSGGYPAVGICKNPLGTYGHKYKFVWNSTAGTFQVNGTNQCLGYSTDAVDGALQFFNCSTFTTPHFERVPVVMNGTIGNGVEQQQQLQVFQLRTPQGFCLGSPRRYSQGATLQSDQWKVVFGVDGVGCNNGGNNFTYLQSLQVWQPTLKAWSINFLHSSRIVMEGRMSMSSITSLVPNATTRKTSKNSKQKYGFPFSGSETMEEDAAPPFFENDPRAHAKAAEALPLNSDEIRKWSHATGGYFVKKSPTEIIIKDIRVGDVALETWTVSVVPVGAGGAGSTAPSSSSSSSSSSTLSWKIDRTYLQTTKEESSRYQTINLLHGWNTVGQSGVKGQAQFASTLDTTFQWNKTSTSAYHFYQGCNTPPYDGCDGVGGMEPWVYSNSKHDSHWMSLSPADLCIPWRKTVEVQEPGVDHSPRTNNSSSSPIDYAMQWTNRNGLGSMAFGLVSTYTQENPQERYQLIPQGTNISTTLTLTIDTESHDACKAVHQLSFKTGNEKRDKNTKALARLFHMWAGNMLGNSPTSSSCVFESSMYSLMASVFDPPAPPVKPMTAAESTLPSGLGGNPRVHPQMPDLFEALRFEYGFFLDTMVNQTNGALDSVWDILGVYSSAYGSTMWQQQTSLLYGIYVYATTTGDKEFMRHYWENDGPLKKILGFLLNNLGLQEDGLMHCLGSTGNPNPKASCNWLDIVGFGHNDAIVNSEAAIVLQGYADVAQWLGDNSTANILTQLWKKNVKTYNAQFWNESLGLYSDWIGQDGDHHSFGYIWQQGNAANMASGIVGNNHTRLAQMCNAVDGLYRRLYKKTNTTKSRIFATPTNFISVPKLYQNAWHQFALEYENGALFTVQVQFEMQLRHMCNQSEVAIELYDKVVVDQFDEARCWGQHYQWAPGDPPGWAGADVLTDTVMIVVGLLRGGFKIRPTLSNGLIIDQEGPGAAYEGWEWTFYYMGERVTARVKNGKTVITPAE